MRERVAIIEGARTPFCKAGGVFRDIQPEDLAAYAVSEALARSGVKPEEVDEIVIGNVTTPTNSANIARIIGVKAGLPVKVPAFTVNRNCASGMEAVVSGANRILEGDANIVIVGGTESMSMFPVEFPPEMRKFLRRFTKAKGFGAKLSNLLSFRPSMLKPRVPELSDPLCGLTMGQTAEVIAKEYRVTRRDQDEFSFRSQTRAAEALQKGWFADEIIPIPVPPKYQKIQQTDDGIRVNQTMEDLEKLKPIFDKINGTVTAGTSSQVTDGAVALVLMRESVAKQRGLKPIGYITAFASAGLDPSRMGLGPAYAIAKILKSTGKKLSDFDLFEINEAFAAQVIASQRALASDEFAKKELGLTKAVGEIDYNKLNVNGGAIALGHPLGASGARLTLALVKELNRRGKRQGIASLCVGGGQGEAIIVEAAS